MAPLSRLPLLFPVFFAGLTFFPARTADVAPRAVCDPNARPFKGYTFLVPEIIHKNAAYAPFFVQWDDYYEKYYFNRDIQKEENVLEWQERFCDQADPKHIEYVVYQSSFDELADLREMEKGGLLQIDDQWITVLPAGRMLVRAIAMVFDRYLRADRERTRYSKVI